MEKMVLFRDRQEFQAADPNNLQTFARASLDHLIGDAISAEKHFVGFAVTAASATQISVATGRYYKGGEVYVQENVQSLNLFSYLPLASKKICAIILTGASVDTEVEPRDFIVDLNTGETEPQAVAMQQVRQATVSITAGAESADPQAPAIPVGALAVALITLGTGGIETITMQTTSGLPNSYLHGQRLYTLETWRAQAEPRISSIASDLAALGEKTLTLVPIQRVIELASDVARLKEKSQLPASWSSYDADYFGDDDKTDDEGSGYSARIDSGLLFPAAASAQANLALFNPTDPTVNRGADDQILPAFTHAVRLATTGYAGDIAISQYQTQSHTIQEYTYYNWYHRYGLGWNFYLPWYYRWYWDYHPKFVWDPYDYYWIWRPITHYVLEETTSSVSGAIVAQTFLISNAMWLTQVGLNFTQLGATGDLTVVICEAEAGKPVLSKALAQVTVTHAHLKTYPTPTVVSIPPVLLEAGKRYAVALITLGDHRVAVVSGSNYTQGTLFYGNDGEYFVGDLTKDLMFTLYAASFSRVRTEVMLGSASLSGGMRDLAIDAPQIVPEGTSITYEIQVGGLWYRLADGVNHLSGAPDLVPLRAVLLGTGDMAPAFWLKTNAITASRPANALVHWSTERTPGVTATGIEVQVLAAGFNDTPHDLTITLHDGETTYNATGTTQVTEPGGGAVRVTSTFAPSPGITSYQVKIAGSKGANDAPFAVTERIDVVTAGS